MHRIGKDRCEAICQAPKQNQKQNKTHIVMQPSPSNDCRHGGAKRIKKIPNKGEHEMKERVNPSKSSISRRSFLGKSLAVGAGTIGAGLLANVPTARARGGLPPGGGAILRSPPAAGVVE